VDTLPVEVVLTDAIRLRNFDPSLAFNPNQALVHDNGLRSGQHLLLIGASGGVGHVALQVAKAVGAKVGHVRSPTRNYFF
jgi:NADPH:quinone reductase-like Zn-dependent oxidoreductase